MSRVDDIVRFGDLLRADAERIATLERERADLVEALRMMLDGTDTLRYVNARTLLARMGREVAKP